MKKLSDLRSLSIFQSLAVYTSPRPSSSYGSFVNLKIAPGELVKKEASVKTDLEMDTKFKGAIDQINPLEGKLQEAVNENVKPKMNQNEVSELWQGLDSRISSKKTLWQLTKPLAENHKSDLLEKNLKLESDNQNLRGQVQSLLEKKCINSESLQGEITKCDHPVGTLENLINKLSSFLNEKEQAYSCTAVRERTLEDQKLQVEQSLAAIEYKLSQAKKLYDLILQSKQRALSKHLKELSLRNDHVVNEICRKYEHEKAELTAEKEKAEKQMGIESKCNEKLSENKQDFESYVCLTEEHGTMVQRIQQDNEHKESMLWSYQKEELQPIQSQAENEPQDGTLGDLINKLSSFLNEMDQVNSCTAVREKTLEDQKLQVKQSLAAIEYKLSQAKKLYDLILHSKQRGLSKHLKELSLRNDQVVNEICRKYEHEKAELTAEKEKAEKQMEIESKCNEKLSENKQDFESYVCLTEEHGTMVQRIQQDNEHQESTLWFDQKEELQHIQSQAENEPQDNEHKESTLWPYQKEELQRIQSQAKNELRKVSNKEHVLSTIRVRSLHSRASEDSDRKEKDPLNQSYPGNTATVVLDPDNREASLRSYKRAIRKARAWCRSRSKPVDLSTHFGRGAEVFTTPADGTFHLTFLYKQRRLTLFIYGRNLYVKGWHSEKNGTFQIVKDFISDPTCRFVDTGENYNDLCPKGKVALARVGIEALIESFEVVDKCDGVVTTDLLQSLAMFCVGTSEAIRLQDVFEGNIDSFITCFPYLDQDAASWIRSYRFYSEQYLHYLHSILSGDPPPKILNRCGRNITSILELRQTIRVPLRDSFDDGEFEHEKADTPVWSPPYADGKHWDDKQLDEDDEKYWPIDEETEQEDEDLKEKKPDDVRAQKVDMKTVKDHMPLNRSSISRFSTAVASSNMDFSGARGFFGTINRVRMNTSHCQPFLTASGRMKVSEVKSSFAWCLQNFSAWRKFQCFTKFLNKFK